MPLEMPIAALSSLRLLLLLLLLVVMMVVQWAFLATSREKLGYVAVVRKGSAAARDMKTLSLRRGGTRCLKG